jgi:hypothetical protein
MEDDNRSDTGPTSDALGMLSPRCGDEWESSRVNDRRLQARGETAESLRHIHRLMDRPPYSGRVSTKRGCHSQ